MTRSGAVQETLLAVPEAMTGKVETFEVNRPFSEVAETFAKKDPQCLNVRTETVSRTNMS